MSLHYKSQPVSYSPRLRKSITVDPEEPRCWVTCWIRPPCFSKSTEASPLVAVAVQSAGAVLAGAMVSEGVRTVVVVADCCCWWSEAEGNFWVFVPQYFNTDFLTDLARIVDTPDERGTDFNIPYRSEPGAGSEIATARSSTSSNNCERRVYGRPVLRNYSMMVRWRSTRGDDGVAGQWGPNSFNFRLDCSCGPSFRRTSGRSKQNKSAYRKNIVGWHCRPFLLVSSRRWRISEVFSITLIRSVVVVAAWSWHEPGPPNANVKKFGPGPSHEQYSQIMYTFEIKEPRRLRSRKSSLILWKLKLAGDLRFSMFTLIKWLNRILNYCYNFQSHSLIWVIAFDTCFTQKS